MPNILFAGGDPAEYLSPEPRAGSPAQPSSHRDYPGPRHQPCQPCSVLVSWNCSGDFIVRRDQCLFSSKLKGGLKFRQSLPNEIQIAFPQDWAPSKNFD